MNANIELNPTIKPNHYNQPTVDDVPEAYLETLKYKPFRFGDYYFLQQPQEPLKQLLDTPTGSFAELLTLIFNRTHQSRYTVFPTLYKNFQEVLAFLDRTIDTTITPTYNITLLFRASKLAGFRFAVSPINNTTPTTFVSGVYFMSYYNARIDERPITETYTIKREHLVSIIDMLDSYNQTGFVIRTSITKQPIKSIE